MVNVYFPDCKSCKPDADTVGKIVKAKFSDNFADVPKIPRDCQLSLGDKQRLKALKDNGRSKKNKLRQQRRNKS